VVEHVSTPIVSTVRPDDEALLIELHTKGVLDAVGMEEVF
jgi:hypothetical protein